MNKLLFFTFISLCGFSALTQEKLSLGKIQIEFHKTNSQNDELHLMENKKVIFKYQLKNNSSSSKVNKIEAVEKTSDTFYVDYSPGSVGTHNLRECQKVYLLKVFKKFIKLMEEKNYACHTESTNESESLNPEENFSYNYKIELLNKKYKIKLY